MPTERSDVIMSADDTSVQQAFNRQFRALQALTQAVERSGKTSVKASRESSQGFKTMARDMLGFDLSVRGAVAALQQLLQLSKQARAARESDALPFEEKFRAFRQQASIKDDDRAEKLRQQFLGIAGEYGYRDPGQLVDLAQQLRSINVGTTSDDELIAAMTQNVHSHRGTPAIGGEGPSPAELSRAQGRALDAFGLEKSPENFNRIGSTFAELYATYDIQIQELSELAGDAAVMAKQGMTMEQAMATFAELATLNAPERATGMRNVLLKARTAGGKGSAKDALAEIGLTSSDLFTDNPLDGLKTLRDALPQVGEEQQGIILQKLFGQKAITPAQMMLDRIDSIESAAGRAQSGTFLDDSLEIFRGDPATRRHQAQARKASANILSSAATDATVSEELKASMGGDNIWSAIAERLNLGVREILPAGPAAELSAAGAVLGTPAAAGAQVFEANHRPGIAETLDRIERNTRPGPIGLPPAKKPAGG